MGGGYNYSFPKKIELELSLWDLLEDENTIDEKYFLSNNMLKVFTDPKSHKGFVRSEQFRPHNKDSHIAYTITTKAGGRATDNFILVDTTLEEVEEIVEKRRRNEIDIKNIDLTKILKIRKLTPLEVFRLMGVSDKDFYKAQKVNSDTQLFKQGGNAIIVNVLYHIFKEMF